MSNFLVANDFHFPKDRMPKGPTDVQLWGSKGLRLLQAVHNHAQQIGAVVIINGDESSYHPDPLQHFNDAAEIGRLAKEIAIARTIGNHEPITNRIQLGLNTTSHMLSIGEQTQVLICQPENGYEPPKKSKIKSHYAINPDAITALIDAEYIDGNNLLVMGHWAFDRMQRGYPPIYKKTGAGYTFIDNSKSIVSRLTQIKDSGARVLMSGAHEHRYSTTNTLGFQCNVIPAITQVDIDDETKPCGLFAVYESSAKGWDTTYGKISLGKEGKNKSVTSVPQSEIQRYYRAFIPY